MTGQAITIPFVRRMPMLFILLPAFNEEQSLPELIPKIGKVMLREGYEYRLIVGDDGSTDGTAELLREYAKQFPIETVAHPMNRGLGETSRDLFERAAVLADPDDIIVRMDCDDTHNPEHIPALIGKLSEGCDVAIASRFCRGGGQRGVGAYRALISWSANLFMKCLFPIAGVREYSCGFRAYRAALIQAAVEFYGNDLMQLRGLGFTCTLEKLVKLKMLGARFGEVPFVLRYDLKQSESKMVSSITTLGYLVMTVLYHWPWGGWRRYYAGKPKPDFRSARSRPAEHLRKAA